MPAGTCQVCGCTGDIACEFGCCWIDQARLVCSQCACWAVLRKPNTYEGIFPYDLLPVRTLHPTRSNHPSVTAYPIDVRRFSADEHQRVAFLVASRSGITVDEVLASLSRKDFDALAVPSVMVAEVHVAPDVETAAARLEKFRAAGGILKNARRLDIVFLGGASRG